MRTKLTKWLVRFFCHTPFPRSTTHPPTSANTNTVREVRLGGVRSDLLLVSVDGVGVGMMQRRTTRRWRVKPNLGMARLLSLCRHVRRVVPSDFGLDHLVVERDGIRMYFGPQDDIGAILSDEV